MDNVYIPRGLWAISLDAEPATRLRLVAFVGPQSFSSDSAPIRINSLGMFQSFRVIGGPGVIHGVTARRLD